MGKNIRHRDEIMKTFHGQVKNEATDEQAYTWIRDAHFLEVLCDIRDNLHHIAKNIKDFDEYEDGE